MNKWLFFFCFLSSVVMGQKAPVIEFYEQSIHGAYESFHENGQTKAKGNFYYNRRIGDWKTFDKEGDVLVQRFYDSLGNVKVLMPNTSDDKAVKLLDKPRYQIERDTAGSYIWEYIHEGDVVWSKRVWSFLSEEHNPTLFGVNWIAVLNRVNNQEYLSTSKELTVYKDDDFREFYKEEEQIETQNLIIHGIGLKKDYLYDISSRKMHQRVIGVTLFTEDTITKRHKEFVLYYPTDLRSFLVKYPINHADSLIENLDDLFFFNAYNEIIYKEESWKDNSRVRFDPKKFKANLEFNKTIKTQVIEVEHYYWEGI